MQTKNSLRSNNAGKKELICLYSRVISRKYSSLNGYLISLQWNGMVKHKHREKMENGIPQDYPDVWVSIANVLIQNVRDIDSI